jgi:hypothetical protein
MYVCGANGCVAGGAPIMPQAPNGMAFRFHPNAAGTFTGVTLVSAVMQRLVSELAASRKHGATEVFGAESGSWQVISPDGISTTEDGFATREDAEREQIRFIESFRSQGYYTTTTGTRISLKEVARLTRVEPVHGSD